MGGAAAHASVAAVAVRPGVPDSLHRTTLSLQEPGSDEVLVETIRVGVCGTDREIMRGEFGTPPTGSAALVLGHEVLGRIVATGAEVQGLRPGALVSATVRRPDGCPACQAGQPDMCLWREYTERGIAGAHGFMVERFVEQERFLVPIPAEIEAIGVLTEPLTVVEKAVRQADLIQRRLAYGWAPRTAVVLGAGPIGLLGTMLLRSRGVEVVTVARTPAPNRAADLVAACGARYVSSREQSVFELGASSDRIDLILESTGASIAAFEAMQILGTNGVLVLLSLTGGDHTADVPTDRINRELVAGNKTVVGSVNAGFIDFATAVDTLGRFERLWPGLTARLITTRISITDDIAPIVAKSGDEVKMVIEFDR
ncbi:MAG: glucose 1-dehydrogenase [Chloroflexia bacterium]|nr:glucose 1-dehydrogenase [Chloroflexia bacterium]